MIYIRVETSSGVKLSILTSKPKVVPMKPLNVPHLELLGCILLSQLIKEVVSAVGIRVCVDGIFCWTDLEVALCWLLRYVDYRRSHNLCYDIYHCPYP